MDLPETYRKVIANKITTDFAAAAEIVEVPFTQPAPHEIVIRNRFSGVNASDVNASGGFYTPGKQPPLDMGFESVGDVVAVGSEVTSFSPGDPVMTMQVGGGFREYQTINAKYAIPVPEASAEIMSLILSGLTASFGLEITGEMASGETVLVTAAAGGTGHIAVQLAKLAGNHVIGTCSTTEKAEMLTALGCDRVINYREEDVNEVLKAEYPRGINLIYESVGREMFDIAVKRLAQRGRLVIIGYISEYTEEMEVVSRPRIYSQLLLKSASIRGMFLFHFFENMPAHMAKLTSLLQEGKLKVNIDPTEFVGVESVVDAVNYLQSGKSSGKVVVRF